MKKLLFAVLIPTVAHAEPRRLELGLAIGGHAFSSNVELGVADNMTEPGPESGGLLGLRFAFPINQRLAAEAEAVAIPTKDDVLGDDAMVYGLRAHARFDLLTKRIKPFVVAGIGAHVVRSKSPQMDNDADQAYHWGGGVRVAINDTFDLRFDARHLIVPDRTLDGATSDFEVTAGVTYRFGKPKPVPAVEQPKPPPVESVEIVEPVDPDKDKDTILDVMDSCPTEPETMNGWQDDDGCPDRVIRELAGIGFEIDSSRIDSKSTDILERAYAILRDNPTLSVEISGHTSSEGDPTRNLSLSLKRAEAVKAYLVKRGIADTRINTVGHGSDIPIADNGTEDGRRQNRRIEFRILLPGEQL